MAPRIDKAEVVSFRLEVPREALERLPDEVGALPILVEAQPGRRIQVSAASCRLAFVARDGLARLTEVELSNDERGLFFQRVLGPLVVQHQGDLHVKLVWNVAERNSHGDFAEVRIQRGVTTYPGLSHLKNVVEGKGAEEGAVEPVTLDPLETQPAVEEDEIDRLLEEGRKYFEEYQRLKSKAQSQSA
jgi:hypothetical protein